MPLNTATVLPAVTSTIVGTFFSHYLNRKPLKQRPTAHLSYDEGLHLVRSFLQFASRHPVEDLQAFTAQWVPAPQWIKNTPVTIPEEHILKAAELITADLGDEGIEMVGGRKWWQWRIPGTSLNAEWIEMKSHAAERKKENAPCQRVMLYIHGGAYYFGSIDDHRVQLQRHARKLKARVFAPRYRLSPQFPFPCGIQDCLAAYLYLLTQQDASTILIAGDSAGGGMTLALLCLIRNQGLPIPAGGILVSPWVDLTHSFPSVAGDAPMDYIPQDGFHHKPSRAWPPLNVDDLACIKTDIEKENGRKSIDFDVTVRTTAAAEHVTLKIDGEDVTVKDQIQMYTTNSMLKHPLVSPALQPTLGGLPPLLVLSGGGEILRDEQIFLAHKCANPQKYAFPEDMMSEKDKEMLAKYPPTDVQLQCWEDLCHVVPLLSFTRPAKYMYRSIAQFGAWALARAQHTGIEIPDDDAISVISSSNTDTDEAPTPTANGAAKANIASKKPYEVGKAGDPLPKFTNHMIRQHVTRHGVITPLVPEEQLPGCTMDIRLVGELKATTAKKWLAKKNLWDHKFVSAKEKVLKQVTKESAKGWRTFGEGERPPPAALANRRTMGSVLAQEEASRAKKNKGFAMSLWTMLGSRHDDDVVERERQAERADTKAEAKIYINGDEAPVDGVSHHPHGTQGRGRSRSRSRVVVDEHQTEDSPVDENTPVSQLVNMRREREAASSLSPDSVPETGIAGKRPHVEGIAMPFTLDKEPETASMMTLQSNSSPADGEHLTAEKSIDDQLSNEYDLSQANTQQPDAQDTIAHAENSDKVPANSALAVAPSQQV